MKRAAFTLIELSIVLVIIGLLIGGVFMGKTLVSAAALRAQVAQIERYSAAAGEFHTKYNYLPGDITPAAVSEAGFKVVPVRAGTVGQGDGDGLLENWGYIMNASVTACCTSGETAWFWEDLSSNSGLIEGGFNTAGAFNIVNNSSGSRLGMYMPAAKLGGSLYVNVYSTNGANYFDISPVSYLDSNGAIYGGTDGGMMTVAQASAIDTKIDDGLPQSGKVMAVYQNWSISTLNNLVWAAGPGNVGVSDTTAMTGNSTSCFDNGNTAGAVQQYSIAQKKGSGANCALSIKFW